MRCWLWRASPRSRRRPSPSAWWNYVTHGRLVFGARGFRRLPAYAAVYVGIYAVNAFLLARLLALGIHPLVAQAGLSLVMAILSYTLIKAVLTGGRHSGSA